MELFKKLYAYRELLKTNIKKEIRGKYKGSVLGVLWSFINPLLTTLVYAIVFPYLLRGAGQENYLIFLIVAIIPWNFFTVAINQGGLCVRAEANIIKKVYFPREILPISVILSGLINFFISCVILFCFVIPTVGVSWYALLLPVVAVVQSILSLGLVFLISSINVYIKDVEYIVNFIVMMLFYGTPVLYSVKQFSGAPTFIVNLININPMTHIINAYRNILFYHTDIDWYHFGIVAVGSIILMIIGYFVFKHLEKGFAEEL